jgi:hypothetical protein
MRCCDTGKLCEQLELSNISSNINFHVEQLIIENESTYQGKYLTSIASKHPNNIFDTHASNEYAKFLCVSLASNNEIVFNTKPNLIHGKVPMILEVKSRLNKANRT